MRIIVALIIVSVLLVGIGVAAYWGADRLLASAYAARPSPVAPDPDLGELPTGEGGPPLADRLVVILVDGLRGDALAAMPYSDELWARGVSAVLRLSPPVYADASWRTLLTGASAELLGLPLLPDARVVGPSLAAGSLLSVNIAAGRGCALALHASWQRLTPDEWCSARLFVPGDDAVADQQVADGARDMERGQPPLLVVHFSHLGVVGQQYGVRDARYRQAAQAVDGMIRQVAAPALEDGAAVAILSTHGLSVSGSVIGADPAIVEVPFFLVGPGIIPGGYDALAARDVAPTLAALVGLPAPPLSEGQVRYDLLLGDGPWQTGRHLRMGAQRLALARRYLAHWGASDADLASLTDDLAAAQQAFEAGDVETAWRTANMVMQAADGAMRVERAAQLRQARLPRLALALVGWLLIGLFWAVAWGRRTLVVGAAALGGALIGQALYWVRGGRYSLASAQQIDDFQVAAMGLAAVAIVGAVLALLGWRLWRGADADYPLASDVLGAAWALAWIWAAPAAIGYWRQGVSASPHMPEVTMLFWQLWGLIHLWAIALFATPTAWLAAGLGWLAGRWMGARSVEAQNEPGG